MFTQKQKLQQANTAPEQNTEELIFSGDLEQDFLATLEQDSDTALRRIAQFGNDSESYIRNLADGKVAQESQAALDKIAQTKEKAKFRIGLLRKNTLDQYESRHQKVLDLQEKVAALQDNLDQARANLEQRRQRLTKAKEHAGLLEKLSIWNQDRQATKQLNKLDKNKELKKTEKKLHKAQTKEVNYQDKILKISEKLADQYQQKFIEPQKSLEELKIQLAQDITNFQSQLRPYIFQGGGGLEANNLSSAQSLLSSLGRNILLAQSGEKLDKQGKKQLRLLVEEMVQRFKLQEQNNFKLTNSKRQMNQWLERDSLIFGSKAILALRSKIMQGRNLQERFSEHKEEQSQNEIKLQRVNELKDIFALGNFDLAKNLYEEISKLENFTQILNGLKSPQQKHLIDFLFKGKLAGQQVLSRNLYPNAVGDLLGFLQSPWLGLLAADFANPKHLLEAFKNFRLAEITGGRLTDKQAPPMSDFWNYLLGNTTDSAKLAYFQKNLGKFGFNKKATTAISKLKLADLTSEQQQALMQENFKIFVNNLADQIELSPTNLLEIINGKSPNLAHFISALSDKGQVDGFQELVELAKQQETVEEIFHQTLQELGLPEDTKNTLYIDLYSHPEFFKPENKELFKEFCNTLSTTYGSNYQFDLNALLLLAGNQAGYLESLLQTMKNPERAERFMEGLDYLKIGQKGVFDLDDLDPSFSNQVFSNPIALNKMISYLDENNKVNQTLVDQDFNAYLQAKNFAFQNFTNENISTEFYNFLTQTT